MDPVHAAALFSLTVLVPLAWHKPFQAEFTLAKLLVACAALAAALLRGAAKPSTLVGGRTALDRPAFALLAVAALSAVASDDWRTSVFGRYDSWAYGVWGLALVCAAAQLAARAARGRESSPAKHLAWGAALVGGYGALQKAGWDPILHLKTLPLGGRAVSTLGSPVDLGALLCVLWPACLWRADEERSPLAVILAVLAAAGLAASGARGALLGAAVSTVAYLLFSRWETKKAASVCLTLAVLAAAAALDWASRKGASVSDVARFEVWRTAWHAFLAKPWLGWGPDGFEDMFKVLRTEAFVAALGSVRYQAYAHNEVLHVLSGLGLAGIGVYLYGYGSIGVAAGTALSSPSRRLAAALAAGLLGLWVDLQLNPVALEVLLAAGVAAGLLASLAAGATDRRAPRPLLAALALAALLSFGRASLYATVDARYKAAMRATDSGDYAASQAGLAAARRALPCELAYIVGRLNCVGDWINAEKSVDGRLRYLSLADEDAAAAVACHPRQSLAHYSAAMSHRMHFQLGFAARLADARREFDAAVALDPKFEPLLAARRETERLAAGGR